MLLLKRLFYYFTIYGGGIILLYLIVLILTHKGPLFNHYPLLLVFIKPVQLVGILPDVIPKNSSEPEGRSVMFWLLVNLSIVYIGVLIGFLYGVSKLFKVFERKRKLM